MAHQSTRLSTIELLPPEAEPDVVWAIAEIEAGKRLGIDILAEFNARLADRGIAPVTRSTFSRYSLRKRRAFARLKEVREISTVLAKGLEGGADDDLTMAISQFVKTTAFELLEAKGELGSKQLMEIGKALQSVEQAKRSSLAHRLQVKKEVVDEAVETIEKVARESGLSGDTIVQLKRDFLGVRPKPKTEAKP